MKRFLAIICALFFVPLLGAVEPNPVAKPGWTLTFQDEFDGPRLSDQRWFPAYRSGRKVHYKNVGDEFRNAANNNGMPPTIDINGVKSRWYDPNAHYVIEDGILKLRIDEHLPKRLTKMERCVSSIQTSDHRFGKTTDDVQVLDKFAQKYGWFEIRSRMPKGSGLHSAFWLLQSDPNAQEYAPDGRRRKLGEGVVEIDIFEMLGNQFEKRVNNFNVHFTKGGGRVHKMDFDPSEDFHVYALEWSEGELIWYIDGQKVHTYKGETPQGKMFILLGLYQGAFPGWAGKTDPNMPYPRDFEIDYVRVYEKE